MWVKFNDQAPNDPEIDALTDGAFRLWFTAICYSQAEQTDGIVAATKLRRLTPNYKPSHLDELTADNGNPSGPILRAVGPDYEIRNFLKWNKSKAYWQKKRADDRARLEQWRAENASKEGGNEPSNDH